jgi:integrase
MGRAALSDTVTALMTKLINSHNKVVALPVQPSPHARLHDLRHLHATTLLLAGVLRRRAASPIAVIVTLRVLLLSWLGLGGMGAA